MTSRDFCYWLQGYFEIAQPTSAPKEVLDQIQKHLNMVFVHEIDPSHGGPEEQVKLNAVHNPQTVEQFHADNPHLKPGRKPGPGGLVARC